MNVQVTITLTREDIDEGLTAQQAVERVFPAGAPEPEEVHVSGLPYPVGGSLLDPQELGLAAPEQAAPEQAAPEQEELEQATVAPGVEVDVAGVPWNADLHSSNHKKYSSGAEKGRWMWKKGTNKETREAEALALVVDTKSSADFPTLGGPTNPPGVGDQASSGGPAQANGVGAIPIPDNSAPTQPPNVAGFPSPDNAPKPENSGGQPAQTVAPGASLTWPQFLQALRKNNISMDQVNAVLGQVGLEQMAMLSPGESNPKRDEVAKLLGLV